MFVFNAALKDDFEGYSVDTKGVNLDGDLTADPVHWLPFVGEDFAERTIMVPIKLLRVLDRDEQWTPEEAVSAGYLNTDVACRQGSLERNPSDPSLLRFTHDWTDRNESN